MKSKWWHNSVIYQIYPKSFKDSNGDGIGDIQGIIEKLEYIKELGISIIWLTPIFDSPNDDNGYDVRDYYNILNDYGTLDDFYELIEKTHSLGMKIVLDMVVNHTSDEHSWFAESISSKDSPKRDYYIWRDGKEGREPNNWGSFFSPSAWEYDEKSNQYYLHLYSKKQPDLNWENHNLRDDIYKMMISWLDKGVDGFRLDVINKLKKPEGLPDAQGVPTCSDGYVLDAKLYANNTGLIAILGDMNRKVFSKYDDIVTIGECGNATPYDAIEQASTKGNTLDMMIHFDVIARKTNWTLKDIRKIQNNWYKIAYKNSWYGQYLSNHDQPRQVSIYGNDTNYRIKSAKLLATMIHTLPGIPFIYQGEEIGMTNNTFKRIEEFRDIRAKFKYTELLKSGEDEKEAINWLNRYSRDHARTPMQWNSSKNAGFSDGKPWISVNSNYGSLNVEIDRRDKDSIWEYYKKLVDLRKKNGVLVYGDFNDISPGDNKLYIYTREYQQIKWLIILNFSDNDSYLPDKIMSLLKNAALILSNEKEVNIAGNNASCTAWYSGIYKLN